MREEYRKEFGEILVIGDNYKIDIKLAAQQGCKTLHVPENSGKISLEDLIRILE
jgi:ribonucleotide monophosphatase NagD (HAD superfamily)